MPLNEITPDTLDPIDLGPQTHASPSMISVGIQEATRKALQAAIRTAIPDLNTFLTFDSLWPSSRQITPSMVRRGDVTRMPPLAQYPLVIVVEAGGKPSGQDIGTELRTIGAGTPGYRNFLFTNIYIYLHQDVFREIPDYFDQAEAREDLLSRLSDWLRGRVLNTPANTVIALASNETGNPLGSDVLDRCVAVRGYLGFFDKSFSATQTLFGVHLVHQGMVAGG